MSNRYEAKAINDEMIYDVTASPKKWKMWTYELQHQIWSRSIWKS